MNALLSNSRRPSICLTPRSQLIQQLEQAVVVEARIAGAQPIEIALQGAVAQRRGGPEGRYASDSRA